MKLNPNSERGKIIQQYRLKAFLSTIGAIIAAYWTIGAWEAYGSAQGSAEMTDIVDKAGCADQVISYMKTKNYENEDT